MSKETFKIFVRNNPSLVNHVNNNTMTWQKFYEMYSMYGEDNSVWDQYISKTDNSNENIDYGIKDIFDMIKKIDMDTIRKGVNSLQKVVGILQGFATKEEVKEDLYEQRPMYKHFDD